MASDRSTKSRLATAPSSGTPSTQRSPIVSNIGRLPAMDLTTDPRYDAIRRSYPPILSTGQVADILQLDIRTVMKAVQLGHLKASRMPGARKWRFVLEDVIAMIERNFTTVGAGDEDVEDDTPAEPTPAPEPIKGRKTKPALAPSKPAPRGRGARARTT